MLPSYRKSWMSNMHISPFYKTSDNSSVCGRNADFKKNCNHLLKNGLHQKSGVNSIDVEIEVNHGQWYLCVFLVLIVLWLPLVILLFHSHATLQLEISQQKGELILLQAEVENLQELAQSLKHKLELLSFPMGHHSDKIRAEELVPTSSDKQTRTYSQYNENKTSLLPHKGKLSQALRIKRGLNGESSEEMKKSSLPVQKAEVNLSSRRGKEICYNRRWQHTRRNRRLHRMHGRKPRGENQLEQLVHMKGAHPEAVVQSGHVGPWFIDMKAVGTDRALSNFHLREGGEIVEVENKGIYLIYAQVYYLTSHTLNSFSINLLSRNSESPLQIAVCSTNASTTGGSSEISCYTSVARMLQPGDRIYVQQRERNRRLIMRSGHSFLGLVKISAINMFNESTTV